MTKAKAHAAGASKSLNASITEIEDFLKGSGLTPTNSKLRRQLRVKMNELAEYWFGRGFRRGCIEMTKSMPTKMTYNASRDFYSGKKKATTIRWKAK